MTDRFERDLIRGSLDLMVLSVLSRESKYGYVIQQSVDASTGGRVKLPAGTLYPLLHKLEADRLIKSRWESSTGRRRKWYELTAKGRKRLEKQTHQWTSFAECVSGVLAGVLKPTTKPT
ncbi:PadR family transcriptional regulator [Vicingaceae bacterium]|nr:PadR family transcriptional regulator [Vicingaceae bacterium]